MSLILPWWWRWAALVIAMVAAMGFGWVKGNEHGTEKLTEYIGKEAAARVAIIEKQGKVTEKVVTKYIKVKGETQVVTQTIEKEVIRYAEANPGYCLDAEWGRLHDRSAANALSETTFGTDGPQRAPTAAGSLETVTENYARCHRTADKLDALQEWVMKQDKAINSQ